jgi:hypothetical protein
MCTRVRPSLCGFAWLLGSGFVFRLPRDVGKLYGNSSISTYFWITKCVQESDQVCVDLLGSWVRALSSDSPGMWESYVETRVFPRISGLLNVYKSPTKSVWICLALGFGLCLPRDVGKLCGNSSISTYFWITKCVQESDQVCVDLLGSWIRALPSDSPELLDFFLEK